MTSETGGRLVSFVLGSPTTTLADCDGSPETSLGAPVRALIVLLARLGVVMMLS